VTVTGAIGSYENGKWFASLQAALVHPDGTLADGVDVRELVAEAIARMMNITPFGGDKVPEWIGSHLSAAVCLPRFDTAEFLAAMPGDDLRAAADTIGLKLSKVGELRKQLAGALPDWRPADARFGAPGPTLLAAAEDQDDD
jgi:hypothetical protein